MLANRQGNVDMSRFLRLLALISKRTYWYHSHVSTQYCDGLLYAIFDFLLLCNDVDESQGTSDHLWFVQEFCHGYSFKHFSTDPDDPLKNLYDVDDGE